MLDKFRGKILKVFKTIVKKPLEWAVQGRTSYLGKHSARPTNSTSVTHSLAGPAKDFKVLRTAKGAYILRFFVIGGVLL